MLAARTAPKGHVSPEVYHQRWEAGEFDGRRVELLDGEVVEMSPMGTPHVEALRRLTRYLVQALLDSPDLALDVQIPVRAAGFGEPVPDFAVTTRLPAPPPGALPTGEAEVRLLIEVSDSTLDTDLGKKAAGYARGRFGEYWVIDIQGREVIVHREPREGRYTRIIRIPWTSRVESSAIPGLGVTLSEVLW